MRLGKTSFNRRASGYLIRCAAYFAIFAFVMQLAAMGVHHHDVTKESHDCVSCTLAAQLPSTMPPVSIDVVPTLAMCVYAIVPLVHYFYFKPLSFLIPNSQAPPPAHLSH